MSDEGADADGTGVGSRLLPIPIGEKRLKVLFYAGLLAYAVSHLAIAWNWDWENKLFPLLTGATMIVLIVINLVLIQRPGLRERFHPSDFDGTGGRMQEALSMSTDDTGRSLAERHRKEAEIVAWTIALPILVWVMGFAYAFLLFIFVFVVYYTRDVKRAAASTAVFIVFWYIVFVVILPLRLYTGVWDVPSLVRLLPF